MLKKNLTSWKYANYFYPTGLFKTRNLFRCLVTPIMCKISQMIFIKHIIDINTQHDSLPPSFPHSSHFFNLAVIFFTGISLNLRWVRERERESHFICPRTDFKLICIFKKTVLLGKEFEFLSLYGFEMKTGFEFRFDVWRPRIVLSLDKVRHNNFKFVGPKKTFFNH